MGPYTVARKEPLKVLYVECEDGELETTDRCRKLLGGTYTDRYDDGRPEVINRYTEHFDAFERQMVWDNFWVVSEGEVFGQPLNLANERHRKELDRLVKETGCDVLIIDTVKQAWATAKENDNTDTSEKIVSPMKHMAQSNDIAILFIHHSGVDGTRARGATALPAACRWRLRLRACQERDQDDITETEVINRADGTFRAKLEKDKRNLKLDQTYHRIDSDPSGALDVVETERPETVKPLTADERRADEIAGLIRALPAEQADRGLSVADIAQAVGAAERTVRPAVDLLTARHRDIEENPVKVGRNWITHYRVRPMDTVSAQDIADRYNLINLPN